MSQGRNQGGTCRGSGLERLALKWWKRYQGFSSLIENIKFWDYFKVSDYFNNKISSLSKIGKGVGAVGTILTIGTNTYDSLFENGEFRPTLDGVQDTITDTKGESDETA